MAFLTFIWRNAMQIFAFSQPALLVSYRKAAFLPKIAFHEYPGIFADGPVFLPFFYSALLTFLSLKPAVLPKIAFHEYPGDFAGGLDFCRFVILPCRLLFSLIRQFCRKSRFTKSPARVPEMRFHVFGRSAKPLINNETGDKRRLSTIENFTKKTLAISPAYRKNITNPTSYSTPSLTA